MKALNTLTFPLQGTSLIEASAGTGKTYTIVNLYLRMLLGHGCDPLKVDQILVVTFTNAATAELKERIRGKLQQTYLDFYLGASDDPFVQALIEASSDPSKDAERLLLGAKMMDEASVFTIHSFCQQMLSQHAFESGILYEQTLIMDESDWQKLACDDYWRREIVGLDSDNLSYVLSIWSSPEDLLAELRSLLSRPALVSERPDFAALDLAFSRYAVEVKKAKQWWLEQDVSGQLLQANLKKNTKLGKGTLLANMQGFCHSNALRPEFDKDGWDNFTPEKISKAKSAKSSDLSHLDFSRFEQLAAQHAAVTHRFVEDYSRQALNDIRANLSSHKSRLNLLSPDDLLNRLERALEEDNSSLLSDVIRRTYPAAMIDEFQDTDPIQFGIFSRIYPDDHNALVMIGDPKQAIYGFRGADIFTYIDAKRRIAPERQFTLGTNWRTQESLVDATNRLFERSEAGFLFERDIPFQGVDAAKPPVAVTVGGATLPSMVFQHYRSGSDKAVSWAVAQQKMAQLTAMQISALLLSGQIGELKVQAADCCVLVRDRLEAALVKTALQQNNVSSVFLVRKSVFDSITSHDLYRWLLAIANPHNESLIRSALCCESLGYSAQQLENWFNDDVQWQSLVELCYLWQKLWQSKGVMMMLNHFERHFDLSGRMASLYDDGARRLTDFRHLSELLQAQSEQLPSESQLLHWCAEQIMQPDHASDAQQLRLDSDADLVQIVTIHASKGLEFPLVFIPFAARFRETKLPLYHDQNQDLHMDFTASAQALEKADYERLAEDIRLFYVAATRAIYHCSIGIWNCAKGTNTRTSALRGTAIGHLLMGGEDGITDEWIGQCVQGVAEGGDVGYTPFEEVEPSVLPPQQAFNHGQLTSQVLNKPVERNWRMTSYSAISRQQHHDNSDAPGHDEGHGRTVAEEPTVTPDRFGFPKGAQPGSFLHAVFENIDFVQPDNLAEVIEQQATWYGIDQQWHNVVEDWVRDVLATPMASMGSAGHLALAALPGERCRVEMEFYLPVENVRAEDFNALLNRHFPQFQRHYEFGQLRGMVKGFIDLTFEHDGVFYVADYKSNHLGGELADYQGPALQRAMQEHDYELQAILYTLALHRWLSSVLKDYDYSKHIGGALYLFLRGMHHQEPGSGVYHFVPEQSLIVDLDRLFQTGELPPAGNEQQEQLGLW